MNDSKIFRLFSPGKESKGVGLGISIGRGKRSHEVCIVKSGMWEEMW